MIKVGIDTSILQGPSGARGVGKYTTCLIKAFKEFKEIEVKEVKDNDFGGVDLVHYPYFDFFFLTLPFRKTQKTIVTIHDCIPLVFPRHYPPGVKGRIRFNLQKWSLRNVFTVLTDSESSKRDIIKFLDVPQKKIAVIYLAADPIYKKSAEGKWQMEIKQKYNLPEKFILYVGDVNYNKNLPGLIRSFNLVEDLGIKLVFVGKSFEDEQLVEVKELKNIINMSKLKEKIEILGFVPDRDLSLIYNLALVYCMPSFYEGFGIQVLEAMACGCPVVTSNISSMPEVAEKAAVLVNPNDVNEIAGGIRKLIGEKEFRNKIIDAGLKRVKEFSWEKTARQTIEIYEKILAR